MPFADGEFASVVSNSVLEHIPFLDPVLAETARVLQQGGYFIFCVPNQRFTEELQGTTVFRKIGWPKASRVYSRLFNRISRHAHTDSHEVWEERLLKAGFTIEKCWDYFPPPALHVLEAGHFFGLPSLVVRRLTGKWILVQSRANLWLPWVITHRHVQNPIHPQGVYSFYITRRQ